MGDEADATKTYLVTGATGYIGHMRMKYLFVCAAGMVYLFFMEVYGVIQSSGKHCTAETAYHRKLDGKLLRCTGCAAGDPLIAGSAGSEKKSRQS